MSPANAATAGRVSQACPAVFAVGLRLLATVLHTRWRRAASFGLYALSLVAVQWLMLPTAVRRRAAARPWGREAMAAGPLLDAAGGVGVGLRSTYLTRLSRPGHGLAATGRRAPAPSPPESGAFLAGAGPGSTIATPGVMTATTLLRSSTTAILHRVLLLGMLILLVAGLTGCGALEDHRGTEPPVETAPLSGTWDVTSRFEVPATVAAPGPLGDALRAVHVLNTDPGAALLDLAEAAGVPAVSELRLVLPDALESQLTGWMNGYLDTATVDGVSPHGKVAELDALIRSVLLRFELRSTLSLPVDGAGTHAPVALAFGAPAGPVVVPLEVTAPVTSGVDVLGTLAWVDGPAGAPRAVISDHAMGIPFGRYALAGLDALLLARHGAADLRAYLADAVGCAALAASVADRCLGPLCVGNEATLRAVCEAGVEEAAARLEARILDLDYKALHFAEGTAVATAGGALGNGTWTASIDLGNGAEQATAATFTGTR